MNEITMIGADLAKSVFQLHGVGTGGRTVLRGQPRRNQMLEFFRDPPECLIRLEACAGSHYWARELAEFGHVVRLMQRRSARLYRGLR